MLSHIRWHRQDAVVIGLRKRGGLLELSAAAAGQHRRIARIEQRQADCPANAAPRAGHQCDSTRLWHGSSHCLATGVARGGGASSQRGKPSLLYGLPFKLLILNSQFIEDRQS